MMSQQDYWKEHYRSLHVKKTELGTFKSMDYPNDRLQTQTYAHVLEALGRLNHQTLLDAGCGWGQFSLMAHFLGASVTAVDFVPETVQSLREQHPFIRWTVANFSDPKERSSLGFFDRVCAVEVLQYADFRFTVSNLWELVAPGGRLVACVPNALCPFVQGVHQRLDRWIPVAPQQIAGLARTLPDFSALYLRGLTYLEDQSFLPYSASPWGTEIVGTPNRIVFSMLRQ
ncbi:MAG TPA: class I SAM-dependent methyltransferase [Bryobacteraceae bacterium]|nr:class I SAM-dependent methyltransferase [Bryobacteraceae bacterium]